MQITPALLKACSERDRKAQNTLYREVFSVLMSICMRYEKNESDIQALLNDIFVKIILNLEKYKSETVFEAWVRRIAINTAIDRYRANQRHSKYTEYKDFSEPINQNTGSSNGQSQDLSIDASMNAEYLQFLLQKLPENTRQAFNLFAIDGYSHKEISDLMGFTESNSRWHVSQARSLLRKMLESQKEFPPHSPNIIKH